jgi:hypothetical protein
MLDAALTDTIEKFPMDIQPFRDMIEGMRMDLVKARYDTFDELYEYCYRVAGTVGLMTMPVMGIDPAYKVRKQARLGVLPPVHPSAATGISRCTEKSKTRGSSFSCLSTGCSIRLDRRMHVKGSSTNLQVDLAAWQGGGSLASADSPLTKGLRLRDCMLRMPLTMLG